MTSSPPSRWNHNIHYQRRVMDAVPRHAVSALDVGTGDGLLAVDLRRVLPDVSAIDLDGAVLERARSEGEGITWLQGDVMTYAFDRRFDVVASVATLHHLPDLPAALRRLADLTAPGGRLIVVGLARATLPHEVALHLFGVLQHHWNVRRRGHWEHTAPTVWPPPHSYTEVRRSAATVLPGMRWRLLPMWRYLLVWTRPV